jgi:cell wall-associated NlpC family hydrolase
MYAERGRKENAVDCLGFILLFFRKFGCNLPDLSPDNCAEWHRYADEVSKAENPRPGDILVLTSKDTGAAVHAALVLDQFTCVHAIKSHGVIVSKVKAICSLLSAHPGFYRLKELA